MSPRNAPALLAVGDDLGDRVVGAADLGQVGAAEGVGGPRHLDDDHLHQLRVVAVGVDDEAGDGFELGARRGALAVGLLDRRQQQRPALAEELVEDLVLGLEVVVDEAVGDAGLVGDVGDAGRVEALAGEDADRRVEDLAALVDGGGGALEAIRRGPPSAAARCRRGATAGQGGQRLADDVPGSRESSSAATKHSSSRVASGEDDAPGVDDHRVAVGVEVRRRLADLIRERGRRPGSRSPGPAAAPPSGRARWRR